MKQSNLQLSEPARSLGQRLVDWLAAAIESMPATAIDGETWTWPAYYDDHDVPVAEQAPSEPEQAERRHRLRIVTTYKHILE